MDNYSILNKLLNTLFYNTSKRKLVPLQTSIYNNYTDFKNSIDINKLIYKINTYKIENLINALINLNHKIVYNTSNNISIILINIDIDYIYILINHNYGFINICLFIEYILDISNIINKYNYYLYLIIEIIKKYSNDINCDKLYLINDCFIYYNNNYFKLSNILNILDLYIDYNDGIIKRKNISLLNDKLEDINNYDDTFYSKFELNLKDYINWQDILLKDFANKLFYQDTKIVLELIKFIEDYITWNYPNYFSVIEYKI